MKREQIIEAYKKKYSGDIVHPCQLTTHELQMLDFCIEYFTSELSSEPEEIIKALTGEKTEDVKTITSTDYQEGIKSVEEKLYQCPYERACKCNLKDCCLECETFGGYLNGNTIPAFQFQQSNAGQVGGVDKLAIKRAYDYLMDHFEESFLVNETKQEAIEILSLILLEFYSLESDHQEQPITDEMIEDWIELRAMEQTANHHYKYRNDTIAEELSKAVEILKKHKFFEWSLSMKAQKVQPSDEDLRPIHKCKLIARAKMGEGRDWWCGKLIEPVKEYPLETHCLHLKTQLKEVIFLCNEADFQQLQLLGRSVTGKLNERWIESMLKIITGQ